MQSRLNEPHPAWRERSKDNEKISILGESDHAPVRLGMFLFDGMRSKISPFGAFWVCAGQGMFILVAFLCIAYKIISKDVHP